MLVLDLFLIKIFLLTTRTIRTSVIKRGGGRGVGGGGEVGGPAPDPATHLLGQGAGEARQEAGPGHFH